MKPSHDYKARKGQFVLESTLMTKLWLKSACVIKLLFSYPKDKKVGGMMTTGHTGLYLALSYFGALPMMQLRSEPSQFSELTLNICLVNCSFKVIL